MDVRDISPVVVSRLPRYFRYLGDLKDSGVERISSQELSSIMKVTASQIRQDFNHFGGFGQQGYGYNVANLYEEIGHILGIDRTHHVIVIGAGHIGQALANYTNFENRGFVIDGVFDKDPSIIGNYVRNCKVMDIEDLPEFTNTHRVDIAIITVPKSHALEVGDLICKCGIKAIMNFAHIDLSLPPDIIVENIHLSDTLLKLSYRLQENK